MAEKIGEYMAKEGVWFVRPAVPTKVGWLVEFGCEVECCVVVCRWS